MPNHQNLHPYIEPIWNNVNLEFMIKFCVIYFFVVWIALIIWVAKDISSRSYSRIFQVFCVLLMILFTPFGILLYILIRPKKSINQNYNEEIEGNLGILNEIVQEHIDASIEEHVCPGCSEAIEPDFIICPSCKTSLKDTCHHCHKLIREGWSVCPYCEKKQKKKKKSEKNKEKKTNEKQSEAKISKLDN